MIEQLGLLSMAAHTFTHTIQLGNIQRLWSAYACFIMKVSENKNKNKQKI